MLRNALSSDKWPRSKAESLSTSSCTTAFLQVQTSDSLNRPISATKATDHNLLLLTQLDRQESHAVEREPRDAAAVVISA